MENDHQQPVFPPEIFETIIDILATRPSAVTLTEEQSTTLKACSLVCNMFLDLARAHIFRLVLLSMLGTGDELDRLLALLERTPCIKKYIQELCISVEVYARRSIPKEDLKRKTDILLELPSVKSIAVSGYTRSATDDASSFCKLLIETHAERGNLCRIAVKKMASIPYTSLFACTSMTTLSLDRCNLPVLTGPIATIKHLTLRKMPFSVSMLSYFPNLVELRIIRADINESTKSAGLSAPSFTITSLSLEQCSEHGGSGAFVASVSTLLKYFYSEAEKRGIKPFDRLTNLGAVLRNHSDLAVFAPLLKDSARTLQSFTFGAYPPGLIPIADVVKQLRSSGCSISSRYGSLKDFKLASEINMSMLTILPPITSFYPSISLQRVLEHPIFTTAQDGKDDETNDTLETLNKFISLISDNVSGFVGVKEVELYLVAEGNEFEDVKSIRSEQDVTDDAVNKIANAHGILIGTCFADFNHTQWSKARMAICL